MIVIFFLYFIIRASRYYHDTASNLSRIIGGSIIAGSGSGVLTGFLLWCVLPTYYHINAQNSSDGHYARYVIDENFVNEYGRMFLVNHTKTDCYLMEMAYGDAKLEEEEFIVTIPSGSKAEAKRNIDEWFKPFPNQVSSEHKGEVRWHVLSESMLQSELKQMGVELNN